MTKKKTLDDAKIPKVTKQVSEEPTKAQLESCWVS